MPNEKLNKIITIILLIILILCIIGTIYIILNPKQTEYFTEFYILGKNGKAYDYPTDFFVGENQTVIIGIVNHENRTVNYYVEIYLVNMTYNISENKTEYYIHNITLMDRFNITLPPKPLNVDKWEPQYEKNYTFTIKKPGKWQLWFILYKDKVPDENATNKINDAINNKYLSLKLNINVKNIY